MPRISGASAAAEVVHACQVAGYVAALAWALDGQALGVADDSGGVTGVWVGVGSELIGHHAGGALTVGWAPGRTLASGGRDGRVRLDGRVLEAGAGWVERVAWRPDGALLALASGRKVQFWTADGACRDVSDELPATVACLAWHPKGVLCGAGSYGGVRLIRANGGRTAERLDWTGSVLELAFSPDGRRLAHGNQDASVHFWDLPRRAELEMTGYPLKVRELAWSSDGRWLATGGGDTAVVWDFHRPGGPAGSRPHELARHTERLTALAFQSHGPLLASAARDGLVLLWHPDDDDLPVGGHALDQPASALAWSADGARLAAGGTQGAVVVLDVHQG
jgi:WD40 repeat protein